MKYLIEMLVPAEGWRPFDVIRDLPLTTVMSKLRSFYPGDEIDTMRVRRLDEHHYLPAVAAVTNYWGAPWKRPMNRSNP